MDPKIHFVLIYFLSIVLHLCCVLEQPTAFTIKLIHRYAPESPFYIANLSDQEIVERLSFQSRTREQRAALFGSTENKNDTLLDLQAIHPLAQFEAPKSVFLVKVSLGTFSRSSHKSYYLVPHIGSSITWLQCEDCKSGHHCYRQIEPPFSNSESSSYEPLPCDRHPLCFPNICIGDSCSYSVKYVYGSHSVGILARENFAIPSSTGHEEIVSLVFGCGINNKITYNEDQDLIMAGIFGLGWGPHSFVTQANSFSQGRFSYCLLPIIEAAQGLPAFLQFGSDIPIHSTLPKTRLIQYNHDPAYYVTLLDIAINGARLNIPPSYFKKGGVTVGGCIFDLGQSMTSVSKPAYQMIKQAVVRYIARFLTSLETVGDMFGYDLCYRTSKPFRGHSNLPSITFHFDGNNADLVIKPKTAFYINAHHSHYEYICLVMIPASILRLTVIGSDLQANQLVVYDVPGERLYFGPQDCSLNY